MKSRSIPVITIVASLAALGNMALAAQDTGGWGYAQFDYDPASDTLAPNTSLQGNDAKCGHACHEIAAAKDYIFTAYGAR